MKKAFGLPIVIIKLIKTTNEFLLSVSNCFLVNDNCVLSFSTGLHCVSARGLLQG